MKISMVQELEKIVGAKLPEWMLEEDSFRVPDVIKNWVMQDEIPSTVLSSIKDWFKRQTSPNKSLKDKLAYINCVIEAPDCYMQYIPKKVLSEVEAAKTISPDLESKVLDYTVDSVEKFSEVPIKKYIELSFHIDLTDEMLAEIPEDVKKEAGTLNAWVRQKGWRNGGLPEVRMSDKNLLLMCAEQLCSGAGADVTSIFADMEAAGMTEKEILQALPLYMAKIGYDYSVGAVYDYCIKLQAVYGSPLLVYDGKES